MPLPDPDIAAQLSGEVERAAAVGREAAERAREARLSLQKRQRLAQAAGDRLRTLQERAAARVAATAAMVTQQHGRRTRVP